jgi:hypothetical protein
MFVKRTPQGCSRTTTRRICKSLAAHSAPPKITVPQILEGQASALPHPNARCRTLPPRRRNKRAPAYRVRGRLKMSP